MVATATTFVIKSVGEVGHANMTRVQDAQGAAVEF